ncbi:hypothetical protein DYBT9275_03625 [Dyadobacter sp. CECT 9275]|uniref:T9SS type A sorting domain-containing protein n=1 Tax=Dyadobacter helix TaxID=2822344 RepID=A0A916ND31_9BACT|nr:T9SS type A sorting domain-containing protein [Dyadobacter sp. CECT 9275]CAG5005665.1 hypothetical protein DYBT9275_03625 [Dyadobacter sp. CECT 9275]
MAIYKMQVLWLLFSTVVLHDSSAQITYFDQDFNGGGPYTNPSPDVGQFTDLIETVPSASFAKFENGSMDMIRTLSSGGGSVRVLRTVPFSPNPETLYIQIYMTVKDILVSGNPAMYFYIGENFSRSTFPSNNSLFSRPSITLNESSFIVRDIKTNSNSSNIALNTPVLITWVLNNSNSSTVYKMPESAAVANHSIGSRKYDLWMNDEKVVSGGDSYDSYSPNKLSNFEIRFYQGVGTISIDKILIRDIDGVLPVHFKSFEAKLVNDQVDLFWETELEQEVSHYMVERSTDNINFTKIGELPAAGNLSGYTYAYRDEYPYQGNSYYRISERDRLGKAGITSNSKDIIYYDAGHKAFVYPNPSRDGVVHLKGLHKNFKDYRFSNLLGQEIPHQGRKLSDYEMDIYPVVPLRSGLYFISYHKGIETETIKIVVSE